MRRLKYPMIGVEGDSGGAFRLKVADPGTVIV
jgi:hypothetical protein